MGYIRDENGDIILDELGNPLLDGIPTTASPTTVVPTTIFHSTAVPTTTLTTGAPTTNVPTTLAPTTLPPTSLTTAVPTTSVPTTLAPTTVAPTTLHISTPVPTTTLTLPPPDTVIPTTLAPVATPVPATAPPVIPPLSTPQNWKDNKGAGPWQFAAQPNKWGYLNNRRWSGIDKADAISVAEGNPIDSLTKHIPCGHWHKQVVITAPPVTEVPTTEESIEPQWQQSLDVIKSLGVVGVGSVAENSKDEFILSEVDYNTDTMDFGKVIPISLTAAVYPGTTLIKYINGVKNVFYINFTYSGTIYPYLRFYRLGSDGSSSTSLLFDGSTVGTWLLRNTVYVKQMSIYGDTIVVVYKLYRSSDTHFITMAAVSHDLGVTWNHVVVYDDLDNELTRTYIDYDSNGVFYISAYFDYDPFDYPFVLWKSTDDGDSWNFVNTIPTIAGISSNYSISIDISGTRVYIVVTFRISAVYKNYAFYSDDGGGTWTSNLFTVPTLTYVQDLQMAANGNVLVCSCKSSTTTRFIIRSTDAGATWAIVGQIDPTVDWPNLVNRFLDYANVANDEEVFVYTHCGAYFLGTDYLAYLLSTDNGATWTVKQLPISRSAGVPTVVPVPSTPVSVGISYDEPQIWEV